MSLTESTRRELLASFLGLPFALSGCGSWNSAREIEGGFVGPSVEWGHRLRDRAGWPEPSRTELVDVLIVGAGVAGLSAARRLARAGELNFRILELEPAPGGTSRGSQAGTISYPWGAHYLPAPARSDRALLELLNEVGAVDGCDAQGDPVFAEQCLCRDPQERIFYKGEWFEGLYLHSGANATDLAEFARFYDHLQCWATWRDGQGRRAFRVPVDQSSSEPELRALDRISMADWMDEHGFQSPRLRWFVDYACRDDYGLTLAQTSAWAALFYFASRVSEAHGESQPLLTWPEGNARLVAQLQQPCASHLELGWGVAQLSCERAGNEGRIEAIAVANNGQQARRLLARSVIFAGPQFLTKHILRDYQREGPAHLAEFQYGSWLVANLTLSDRPVSRGFPLCWDNVLYESPSLGYVCATHQNGPEFGPTVLTYYYPFCDDDPRRARERLLQLSWQEWVEVILADLSRAHPGFRDLVQRVDVMRWGHAMIRPRPGFLWGPARAAAQRPYRGIHFANTDLSGMALFEEAFTQGLRAAEEVLHVHGREFSSWL